MQSTYSNIFSSSPVSPEDYLQNVQAESHTLSENIDRIHHLERRFFSNLGCCESSTFSLHSLVGHYEDEHAALADVRPSPVKALQLNRNPGIVYSQLAPFHTASPFIDAVQSAYLPGFGQNYDTELFSPDSEFGLVPSTSPVFAREFPEFDQFEGTPPPSSPTPSSPLYSSPSSPSPSSSGSSSFPSTASSSALSSPVCPSAPMLPEVDMPRALASLMGNASMDILPHDQEDGYVPSIMRKDRTGVKAQNRSERGVGKEAVAGGKGGKGKAKGAFSAEKAAAKAASKQRREKAYKCPHTGCTKSYLNPNGLKYHLEKGTCCFEVAEPEPSPPPVSSSAPASLVSSPTLAPLSLPAMQPASMHLFPYPIASPTPMVPVSSQPPYLSNTLLS
ncbi:hypothetical protein EYR40_008181 [Pleurotus pulmonarius]|nr:hypothetical protein EYR36_009010 [Pleurotus pulmonarius]KAF4596133.1 hypothetical protein EYR38_007507 [Pleurotus pulmonarius]KAF4597716.1 hypothetical protein EYR40_008181 [Pleurotus pulmonarius]